jgi:hypothetical protein
MWCSSHEEVQKKSRNSGKEEEVETEVRKWLKQQSKDFYAVGFDALI